MCTECAWFYYTKLFMKILIKFLFLFYAFIVLITKIFAHNENDY